MEIGELDLKSSPSTGDPHFSSHFTVISKKKGPRTTSKFPSLFVNIKILGVYL